MTNVLKKYPKICPRCKALYPGVWKECSVCKKPLVNGHLYYMSRLLKKVIVFVLFVCALAGALYYFQAPERKQYSKSLEFLLNGEFDRARKEFWEAFSANPVYKSAKSYLNRKIRDSHQFIDSVISSSKETK